MNTNILVDVTRIDPTVSSIKFKLSKLWCGNCSKRIQSDNQTINFSEMCWCHGRHEESIISFFIRRKYYKIERKKPWKHLNHFMGGFLCLYVAVPFTLRKDRATRVCIQISLDLFHNNIYITKKNYYSLSYLFIDCNKLENRVEKMIRIFKK